MKSSLFESMGVMFNSLAVAFTALFAEKPLYDKDFDEKLGKNQEDRQRFFDQVRELKEKGIKEPCEVEIGGKKIEIVVE